MVDFSFTPLVVDGVRGLQPYQPGKPIETLEREYGITDIIKLASNESPLGPSDKVQLVLREALADLSRYPDGSGYRLKGALEQHLSIEKDCFTLGNGSNDVLELIARAFVATTDEVIFSQYAFAIYPIVTQAIGAKAIVVPAQNWGHDLAGMLRGITEQTRLIFIANPNNPTGTWLSSANIEAFLAELPRRVLVVIDEAYYEYVDESAYDTALHLQHRYPNVIVTRTFSKAYGLAGLRVGFGVSHPEIAEILNRVRQPFNVNHLALVAASAALQDQPHVKQAVAINQQGMQYLTQAMQQLGVGYIPSEGNFLTIDLAGPAEPIYTHLLKQGIIVRPLANCQMPQHLRVTIGLPDDNRRFVEALTHVLKKR